jgi:hypothetical protein
VPLQAVQPVTDGAGLSPSWAAFKRDGKDDMVMGDLVLVQDQIRSSSIESR